MNFPNLTFWSNLLGTVGLEVCAVFALGIAAQGIFRRAYWKRGMWQITLLCLILISVSEWTGAGRGAVLSLFGKNRIEQTVAPQTLSSNTEFYTTKTIPAVIPPLPAPEKPVWWPGLIWLTGIVIVLGRMTTAQGLLLLLRLRREKIVDSDLQERVVRIAKMLGLRRSICLLRLPESISPMAFGILFPTIGLPPGFEMGFSAVEQDAILAHELAHLTALDPLWFRLADFASAILWWHPLAWWARRSLHGASELAADEATALVPDGPGSLAHCLVSLGKKMTVSRGWGWTGINGGFRSKLGKRVERLTHLSGGHGKPLVRWRDRLVRIVAILLIVPAIVLLFGAFQTAKGEKENAWRNSWNSSPGVLLAMAAAEETDSHEDKPVIASLIQDAKLLYEKDKLDEAEVILVHILKYDPSNKTAAHYLAIINEARSRDVQQKLLMIYAEREVATQANYLNDSNILSKLSALPETKLGAELLTAYTNLADSELKEKSNRLSFTKEVMTAAKAEYGKENPKYKKALEEFQKAKDDYDNKAVAIFEGIRARVDGESNFLQIIKQNEEDIKTRYKTQTEIPALKTANQTPSQETIAERITNAKLLYEMGKLSESQKILTEILKDDPSNAKAAYYLNLIKEAQFMNRHRDSRFGWDNVQSPPPYRPPPTNPAPIPLAENNHRQGFTYGRQFILYKLKTIHLDEVSYDLPLTEVLKQLTVLSEKKDTEGLGISFIVKNRDDFVSQQSNTSDGTTSFTFPIAVNSVKVKISPTLHDLCLKDVLEAIVMSADQPIEYKVEDNGVVFLTKSEAYETLYSKTFHFDPVTFKKSLLKASGPAIGNSAQNTGKTPDGIQRTNETLQLDQMLRNYFEGMDVDLTDPGKSIFYSDSKGLMLVRATAEDLQVIEDAVAHLNQMPPQVVVEAKFVELSQQEARELGFENFLQTKETNFTRVLSPNQYQTEIQNIKQNTHEEIVSMPKVSTLSGRQVHTAVQDLRDNVPVGPVYDMVPTVLEDGYTIKAVFIPIYTEFLQNDPPGTFTPSSTASSGTTVASTSPLPHYRARQTVSTRNILDGETLVDGQWVSNKPSEPKKLQLYFVTPRIIDATGYFVHSDEELANKHNNNP